MMNAQISTKTNNVCTLATPFGTCFQGGFRGGRFHTLEQVVEATLEGISTISDFTSKKKQTTFVTFQLCMFKVLYPPGKYHISYLGKLGKSSTQKCRLLWDMLVPRRVSQLDGK